MGLIGTPPVDERKDMNVDHLPALPGVGGWGGGGVCVGGGVQVGVGCCGYLVGGGVAHQVYQRQQMSAMQ